MSRESADSPFALDLRDPSRHDEISSREGSRAALLSPPLLERVRRRSRRARRDATRLYATRVRAKGTTERLALDASEIVAFRRSHRREKVFNYLIDRVRSGGVARQPLIPHPAAAVESARQKGVGAEKGEEGMPTPCAACA